MKKDLKQIIFSFLVFLLGVFTIFLFDTYTKPLVAQIGQRDYEKLKKVIDAFEFIPVIPDTLWQAYDSAKNLKGIVFRVYPSGYKGLIPIITGVGNDLRITGVWIGGKSDGFNETEGLGSKVRGKKFLSQFINRSINEIALKEDGGVIDAISGATISSRAVCEGIRKGMERFTKILSHDTLQEIKREVFPDARIFAEIIKDTLWYAISYPETLGVVFVGETLGYLDKIRYIAGINKGGAIVKVMITYSKETEGIGERIREQEFLDKFKSGIPDAITGATISSSALIGKIKNDVKRFRNYLK
uniref:FMN-binding protein n=1 Tax=candidate division WOR-3 bacterium TaxID=2052148 RepID=A0A7V3VTR8_UNCW3